MGDAVAVKSSLLLVTALLAVVSCRFRPDLSRFTECDAAGACAEGLQCWTAEWRCVPLCGEELRCDGGETDASNGDGGGSPSDAGGDAGTPLTLDAGEPMRAVESAPYSWRFEATGGRPPYTFGRMDGGFPDGLQLRSDGVLSGAPTQTGTFGFELRVIDQSSPNLQTNTGAFVLRVSPLLRVATRSSLADAIANGPYNEQLYVTGGTPPFAWTIDAGSALPNGLQLSATGAIAGNVAGAETHSFVAVVTDSDVPPQQKAQQFSVVVRAEPIAPTFMTNQLADGRVGEPYLQQLRVAGGSPPFIITQSGGSLPPGLTFSSPTISGTPSDAGIYNVTFDVSDSLLGTSSRQFSITVY